MPIALEYINYFDNSFRSNDKLRGVSLKIDDGEFVGICGEADSGASALTGIIGRAFPPVCGDVKIINGDAVCVKKRPERFLSERTVEKQLSLPVSGLRFADEEKKSRIFAALEAVGLDSGIIDVSPLSLTVGEMRLVSIAEALMLDCETLLLDDPTEGMDRNRSVRLMESLRRLNEAGKTVVIASNDTDLLAEYVKRVIIMKDGEIACDGSAKSVLTNYYDLIRLNVNVPYCVKCAKLLREQGSEMPDNVLTYRQFIDRLKIIMWRKAK